MRNRIKKEIHDLSTNLASEIEQSLIRLVVVFGVCMYLFFWAVPQGLDNITPKIVLTGIYTGLSLLLFVSIKLRPKPIVYRIISAIFIDVIVLSIFLSLGDESVLGMGWIYLVIIIGNGFRYGASYLYIALVVSIVAFTFAFLFNTHWSNNSIHIFGMYLSMLILPLYMKILLNRLTHAMNVANESTKAKSQFLANMSHEIRTPMNGILGMLELSLKEPLSDPQEKRLRIAQNSANSLLTLINDILDLSKIEAGKLSFEKIDFNIKRLTHDIVQLLKQRADDKGISLKCSVNTDSGEWIKGDPTRIRQAIINLVGNAIKFTEEGGVTVYISLDDLNGQLTLQCKVCDSGIGITPEALRHIFDYFAQADASTTRNFGGSGLGLTLSQRLIHEMGGDINVESELGKGSIFCFNLPVEKAVPQHSIEANQQPANSVVVNKSSERTNILLAEDNQVNQVVIKQMLSSLNCHVTIVENGQLLIDRLKKETEKHYDMIFMDCQMPVMDGYATTEYLQAYWESDKPNSRIPIVALTANAMASDKQKCLSSGMDDYLAKPIRMDALSQMIEKWVQNKQLKAVA